MKKLIILLLPALMLIGCGEMKTSETQVGTLADEMAAEGYVSEESQTSLGNLNDPAILDETVTLTETSESSVMMKIGEVDLLVEFVDALDIVDSESIAMLVNGIEVTQAVAADPKQLQGLLASIVSSATQGIDIFGMDLSKLVNVGIDLIKGDLKTSDLSSVFGVLVEGALNMFLSSVPFGGLIGSLVAPLLDNVFGNDDDNSNDSASSGNSFDGIGDVVSSIIGSITGDDTANDNDSSSSNNNNSSSNNSGNGSSLFNGIFNLITNLF